VVGRGGGEVLSHMDFAAINHLPNPTTPCRVVRSCFKQYGRECKAGMFSLDETKVKLLISDCGTLAQQTILLIIYYYIVYRSCIGFLAINYVLTSYNLLWPGCHRMR